MNSSVSFSESDRETPSRNGTEKRKEHDKLKLEVKDVRDRTSAENLFNSNEEVSFSVCSIIENITLFSKFCFENCS